jgi:hypothetical protein
MNITIKINTDNAAFQEGREGLEIRRILNELISPLEYEFHVSDLTSRKLYNINGNPCGYIEVSEED